MSRTCPTCDGTGIAPDKAECLHDGAWRSIDGQFSSYLMRVVYVGECLKCGWIGTVPEGKGPPEPRK